MTEKDEKVYAEGQRSVWRSLLRQAVDGLGLGTPERALVTVEETRAQLVALFRRLGANVYWDDATYLPDMVEKHLSREISEHMRAKEALDWYARLCAMGSVQVINLGRSEVIVDFLRTGDPEAFRGVGRDLPTAVMNLVEKLERANRKEG